MYEDVEVVPWEEKGGLWGVAYRDATTGHIHAQKVGTRDQADRRAEKLRAAKTPILESAS